MDLSGINERLQAAADQLDHDAHRLRRLHDEEFGQGRRRHSAEDTTP